LIYIKASLCRLATAKGKPYNVMRTGFEARKARNREGERLSMAKKREREGKHCIYASPDRYGQVI